MQNIAEFRIIGRIGKVEVKEKVTYLSVASNYNRKDGTTGRPTRTGTVSRCSTSSPSV